MTPQMRYLSGLGAEISVADHYCRNGHRLVAQRVRMRGGEIDLVMQTGDSIVFVEVKKRRSHAEAAFALGARQAERLIAGATEFLARLPTGLATDCRFDVALVDQAGRIDIIENALAA